MESLILIDNKLKALEIKFGYKIHYRITQNLVNVFIEIDEGMVYLSFDLLIFKEDQKAINRIIKLLDHLGEKNDL